MELDIVFNRNLIHKGYVSISNFIKYASRVQDILSNIGKELDPNSSSATYSLLIKGKKEGSDVYTVIPQNDTSKFGTSPIDESVIIMKKIYNLLISNDSDKSYTEIRGMIKNSQRRKRIFNDFYAISKYPLSFKVMLKRSETDEQEQLFKPEKETRKRINYWKELEVKKRVEEFIGALTVIQAEGRIFLKLRDSHGYSIKYNFIESNLEKYIRFFKKIVKVKGLYNPVNNKLETIESFELNNKIFIDELIDLKFNFPLELELEFHENGFFAINKQLNIIGVGETFKEMYEDLFEDINSAIDLYIHSKLELTPKAQEIKDYLFSLIKIQ